MLVSSFMCVSSVVCKSVFLVPLPSLLAVVAAQQVHVFADDVLLSVGALGAAQQEVDALFHVLAPVGAVPALGGVGPVVELLAPPVEDVGVELHDALVLLGLVDVVVAIAIVGREGVGEGELTLADGHAEHDGVELGLAVVERRAQHHLRRAGGGEGVVGDLLVAHHEVPGLAFLPEVPFEGGRVVAHVRRVGGEGDGERRLALDLGVVLVALGGFAFVVGIGSGGGHVGYGLLCGDARRQQQCQ